jgi:hypothetical protein
MKGVRPLWTKTVTHQGAVANNVNPATMIDFFNPFLLRPKKIKNTKALAAVCNAVSGWERIVKEEKTIVHRMSWLRSRVYNL